MAAALDCEVAAEGLDSFRCLSRVSSGSILVEELLELTSLAGSPAAGHRRPGAASAELLDIERMLQGLLGEDADECSLPGRADSWLQRPAPLPLAPEPPPPRLASPRRAYAQPEEPLSPLLFSAADEWLLEQFSSRSPSELADGSGLSGRGEVAPRASSPSSPSSASSASSAPSASSAGGSGATLTTSWFSDGGPSPHRRRSDEDSLAMSLLGHTFIEDSAHESVRRVLQLGAAPAARHLSEEEIRALPKVCFESLEEQQCSICLEAFRFGQELTATPCDHRFHGGCLAAWMQRASYCPLCRRECGCDLSTCEEGSSGELPSTASGTASPRSPASSASMYST